MAPLLLRKQQLLSKQLQDRSMRSLWCIVTHEQVHVMLLIDNGT
jgi:hypothetical protein